MKQYRNWYRLFTVHCIAAMSPPYLGFIPAPGCSYVSLTYLVPVPIFTGHDRMLYSYPVFNVGSPFLRSAASLPRSSYSLSAIFIGSFPFTASVVTSGLPAWSYVVLYTSSTFDLYPALNACVCLCPVSFPVKSYA